ncbi:hypothetical protein QBC47DRAFT_89485 [Echria macrotheca]|uniref:Uncharacterized protein n=1 Tax=Echria macrotheca TaxID=438768 RepID=A0AAJ0B3C5_9PEZI|nr:hypothetical protein QBC47DRAFT_89485 [Echria macrotheca]
MNIPFAVGRGNGDRFPFVARPRDILGNSRNPPAPHVDEDYDDDRTPLSPRSIVDLEAQRGEMAERTTPGSRFIHRFRPNIPSFFSVGSSRFLRPTSSRYSGDGMPPDTVVNGDESPKTPRFRLAVQDLPSTRLHLPNLTRTWTQGSNGPPSRPPTSQETHMRSPTSRGLAPEEIAEPSPAVLAAQSSQAASRSRRHRHRGATDRHGRRRRHRREGSDRSGSSRSNRSGSRSNSQEEVSTENREERRRRRRRREREGSRSEGSGSRSQRSDRPHPKRFLFCFPWIKSRRIRRQILRCFVSGIFLALILAVYLTLSITKNINSSEFTVLLILIILFVTIFFCHGLIRLCMLIVRGRNGEPDRERLPEMIGPGGYAIPRRPIRVVLARDEEAAGIESETTKTNPPAYGLWRESVRVDPDRIYWHRNEGVEPVEEIQSEDGRQSRGGEPSQTRRPPSYASDDGVSYVVEARPRSIAPLSDVPLRTSLHPAETGRAGQPAAW